MLLVLYFSTAFCKRESLPVFSYGIICSNQIIGCYLHKTFAFAEHLVNLEEGFSVLVGRNFRKIGDVPLQYVC